MSDTVVLSLLAAASILMAALVLWRVLFPASWCLVQLAAQDVGTARALRRLAASRDLEALRAAMLRPELALYRCAAAMVAEIRRGEDISDAYLAVLKHHRATWAGGITADLSSTTKYGLGFITAKGVAETEFAEAPWAISEDAAKALARFGDQSTIPALEDLLLGVSSSVSVTVESYYGPDANESFTNPVHTAVTRTLRRLKRRARKGRV